MKRQNSMLQDGRPERIDLRRSNNRRGSVSSGSSCNISKS
nr:MAG TPA: hypothetical protein [Caudoviricetes sp.]DAK61171.1 MAG TPA: hypothetical protein [Caudoviricetes sp.]DAY81422.1 MAG TPA: hypothetical protein [Caudoviricetes sp.]